MPAVNLSPIFNAAQLFTAGGSVLAGGFINTYLAGSSTPTATYTDSAGTITNANPIQLDAGGRPPAEVWLIAGTVYKFVVTDSLGANPLSFDNISGMAASSGPLTATDLTTTGNTILGDAATDTLNVGAGGLQKDSSGNVFTGNGKIGPNATNQHTMPNVTSDTFTLNAAAQTLTNKTVGTTGLVFSNTAVSAATNLDWYEEGSWTPAITFGGAAVGVTYGANRAGAFTRIGNRMLVDIRMQLTSKGSSVGTALITGLPYGFAGTGISQAVLAVDFGTTLSTITTAVFGYITVASTTSVGLSQQGGAALTDANFQNTTNLYISGQYRLDA